MALSSSSKDIVIGTRKSQLAMWQAEFVRDALVEHCPLISYRLDSMTSEGDRNQSVALSRFATKGIFTKELDRALLSNRIHLAVHSLKDLPTVLPAGLELAAVLSRGRVEDCVIMSPTYRGSKLADLPAGATIGTSSLRRRALIARLYPSLVCKNIRGNIHTRLTKLDEGKFDAIVLAFVGLQRCELEHRVSQILDSVEFPYAVGQGALAVVCRKDDSTTFALVHQLHDTSTALLCVAERSLLRTLEGGCKVLFLQDEGRAGANWLY